MNEIPAAFELRGFFCANLTDKKSSTTHANLYYPCEAKTIMQPKKTLSFL